jgi:hypothetical protein
MKTCMKCGVSKDEDQFYLINVRGKPLRRTKCIACESAYSTSAASKERSRKRNRRYRDEGVSKTWDENHRKSRVENHPEKVRTARIVRSALESGNLIRPLRCDHCDIIPPKMRDGRSGIQAHHEDYSRPLDVIWLCYGCHIEIHRLALDKPKGGGGRSERS